ncbi:MAG: hypothetical protein JW751_08715 [Polyangiaceae bacterium]|nr:hypothetical protein [Polyangiaceae bacterium]
MIERLELPRRSGSGRGGGRRRENLPPQRERCHDSSYSTEPLGTLELVMDGNGQSVLGSRESG